ncbi:MAG: vanadium-dependent haloperoxidase [Verrucomicrobia bacterium]|nr:vanadium-dependent haloperoxidase [Verrucomicrobiota bacterium]
MFLPKTVHAQTASVARIWNEAALESIKIDIPHPPVHARNLFHLSVAMWDAWAAYDPVAVGYAYRQAVVTNNNTVAAREESISYAAHGVLSTRYALSVNATQSLAYLSGIMTNMGYNPANTNRIGDSPSAIGNRAAQAILNFAIDDASNESGRYADSSYAAINAPLILALQGTTMLDPNRWQPLAFAFALTQNGLEATNVQSFVGSQWVNVRPFALTRESVTNAYWDPGPPPYVRGVGDAVFKSNSVSVLRYSSTLDPNANIMIDVSPGGPGKNNALGTHSGNGHPTNPVTGSPYPPLLVNLSDFGRVVAEMWADGPDSETPQGHWNVLANHVADHPLEDRRFEGQGSPLEPLEWDVKMYFAMNAALHDAATAAWTCKRVYDYVRPISSIRWLAGFGQSSDPAQPAYHPNGIHLVSNLVEIITYTTTEPGQRHSHLTNVLTRATLINRIAVNTWPGEPADGTNSYGGRAWILSSSWKPYQRNTFVTPAFPGYVSGHSTFSRAAAEVLTRMTGDAFFPGGYGSFTAPAGSLYFEKGPSQEITLQWATYYDAADEAGISRLYGGIHVAPDDFAGRIMGSQVGMDAYDLARKYFDGSILDEPTHCEISMNAGTATVSWSQVVGMFYQCLEAPTPGAPFSAANAFQQAKSISGQTSLPATPTKRYFRVERQN